MTLRELLAVVAPTKLAQAHELPLAEALHDSEGSDAPLLVRMFTVIGTWIGAAMITAIFVAFEIYEVVPLAVLLGVALFVGAVSWSRAPTRSLAFTQVIWVAAVSSPALLLGSLAMLDVDEPAIIVAGLALALATMFLVRVPSLQVVAAILAVGFATWFVAELELPMYPLWVALPVAAIATAAWIFETAWAARLGRTWSAIAYGLPIGVAGPLTLLSLADDNTGLVAHGPGATIATLAMLALIGLVLVRAMQEQNEPIETRTHVIGVIAVLAVLAARHVPGLSLALLWLLVGHLRKSVELQMLARIQLAGFLFFFYYQLETTLLLKSLWVITTGLVILLGAWVGRPRARSTGQPGLERRDRWLPAIVLVVLTCGLVVGGSWQKQRVLDRGQTLLLPLAPVDPRSLIQGDYMVLRYALEQEMGLQRFDELPDLPRHGTLVIAIDDARVGHFVRLDDGSPLAQNELRLEYRLREHGGSRLRIGAESFFFEEGSAAIYESADFGELIVAEDGEAVLVGLRDHDQHPLGLRLH